MSLPISELTPTAVRQRYSTSCFNLTGDSGIVIAPDDTLTKNSATLTRDDYRKFFGGDSLFVRWRLLFRPTGRETVVRDTDYIKVQASARVEGIQRMDSLLHAGK